ncbi:MAG: twin-arginine translocase TatA/TatE family subunit [Deltaproteobacteria bacterium]|nr:twin-arginine translocase TatA/TatE family subunit [Deltaproteobacteria bacterium]
MTHLLGSLAIDFPIRQAGFAGLGPWELAIILVIVLVVFGAGKLPTVGGAIGQALKNFKKAVQPDNKPEKKDEEPK